MFYNLEKLKAIFMKMVDNYDPASTLNEILDYALLSFRFPGTSDVHEETLEKYRSYKYQEELKSFILELGNLNPDGFNDPLGELYNQVVFQKGFGQILTPESIDALEAAALDHSDLDGKSVFVPGCGSGRPLLAMGRRNRNMQFFGNDTDLLCCKMSLLNLLMNYLKGEIAHMNTLSCEFYRGYRIETRYVGNCLFPCYTEFFNAEESIIWQSLKPKSL